MKELIIKKCTKCGAIVKVIEDCNCGNCGIVCCDEPMKTISANQTDGAIEKHVPTFEIKGDTVEVVVNHVMDPDHYIEWISALYEDSEHIVYLKPGEEAKATFKYVPGMILYSYCNKHLLWKKETK